MTVLEQVSRGLRNSYSLKRISLLCFCKNTINEKQQKSHGKYNKNLACLENDMLLFVDAQGRMTYNDCI